MARITGSILDEDTWRMEQFSKAYVKAIASVVGCSVEWTSVDYDSVDGILKRKSSSTPVRSPQLDLQLKATYRDCLRDDHVSYTLDLKNYDELRSSNLAVPRILVVILIPDDFSQWTQHDEAQLILRKCGYWISLRGEPASANKGTKSVAIPRSQLFDVGGLNAIFDRLESGGLP